MTIGKHLKKSDFIFLSPFFIFSQSLSGHTVLNRRGHERHLITSFYDPNEVRCAAQGFNKQKNQISPVSFSNSCGTISEQPWVFAS